MPKINREECEILKNLDDKWKWIARDKDGKLHVYTTTPHKGVIYWINGDPMFGGIDANLFQFIQWEDEEPHNIAELIEEYESNKEIILHEDFDIDNLTLKELDGFKQTLNAIKESEGAEVKSKEELIEKWKNYKNGARTVADVRAMENADEFINDLNQLDKPEVLPHELPVIPKFVADWIEASRHAMYHLLGAVYDGAYSEDVKEWLFSGDKRTRQDNQDKLTRAWLDGYEVAEEPEQKYYVIFPSVDKNGKGFNYLAKDCYHKELWVEDARTDGLVWEERSSFTEDEIRDLDKGDILFEHFAVKVEELGEC